MYIALVNSLSTTGVIYQVVSSMCHVMTFCHILLPLWVEETAICTTIYWNSIFRHLPVTRLLNSLTTFNKRLLCVLTWWLRCSHIRYKPALLCRCTTHLLSASLWAHVWIWHQVEERISSFQHQTCSHIHTHLQTAGTINTSQCSQFLMRMRSQVVFT